MALAAAEREDNRSVEVVTVPDSMVEEPSGFWYPNGTNVLIRSKERNSHEHSSPFLRIFEDE